MELCKRWKLVKAPLSYRHSMIEEIWIDIHDYGIVTVYDTANHSSGKYTVNDDMLHIKCKWWTQRARLWNTEDEFKEADIVDEFILKLIKDPFRYELRDNKLIAFYNDQEYEFEWINSKN
jgi:hypothetical protein